MTNDIHADIIIISNITTIAITITISTTMVTITTTNASIRWKYRVFCYYKLCIGKSYFTD
jgi:hypothetical protein